MLVLYTTGNKKNVSCLQANKLLLDDFWMMMMTNEICTQLENNINVNNALTLISLSQLFNLSSLSKLPLSFTERCFPMVADSKSFLELDYISVAKIFLSSELFVDTELQVVKAADGWLNYNKARSKYTESILSRIRLPLLSVPALNYISDGKSCFTENEVCFNIVKAVLENKKEFPTQQLSISSRFCNQNNFNILFCGGSTVRNGIRNVFSDVLSIDANCIDDVKTLPPMTIARENSKAFCIKGEIYVFGGVDGNGNRIISVDKYSPVTNNWQTIGDIYDDRTGFCMCSFINDVYVVGGKRRVVNNDTLVPKYRGRQLRSIFKESSCVKFDTKRKLWKEINRMNEARAEAACAVFEGKVVVSGGYNNDGSLNTVEAYDHVGDAWSYLPNMINARFRHKSVSIKNKLFIIGGSSTTCEMFDSRCNKFVLLKPLPVSYINSLDRVNEVITIGSKLVVFGNECERVIYYDAENDAWSEETCGITNNLGSYSCTKVPQL